MAETARSSEEPDMDNIVYLDEYPELAKRVWMRRLHAARHAGETATHLTVIIPFPEGPNDAA